MALTYGQSLLARGFGVQSKFYGRTLSSTDSRGITFNCLLTDEPPIDPQFLLGSDPRELSFAYVLRPTPQVAEADRLQDDSGQQWTVVKLVDNPANTSVILHLIRVAVEDTTTGAVSTSYQPGQISGGPDYISYAGPPVMAPPALAHIVIDVDGVTWTYFQNQWH